MFNDSYEARCYLCKDRLSNAVISKCFNRNHTVIVIDYFISNEMLLHIKPNMKVHVIMNSQIDKIYSCI